MIGESAAEEGAQRLKTNLFDNIQKVKIPTKMPNFSDEARTQQKHHANLN